MTAKEYYKSTRMVETRNWTLEMTLNFAEEYAEALRKHAVSGSALSPVEWLEKEVKKRFGGETFTSVFSAEFEKAKQMEKELSGVS